MATGSMKAKKKKRKKNEKKPNVTPEKRKRVLANWQTKTPEGYKFAPLELGFFPHNKIKRRRRKAQQIESSDSFVSSTQNSTSRSTRERNG